MMEMNIQDLPSYKPWLIPKDKFTILDDGNLSALLQEIHEEQLFLTLIDANGQKYEKSLLLRITNDRVQLDKPPDWNDNISCCHVFFTNEKNTWYFFTLKNIENHQFSISAEIPGDLYWLEI